MIPALNKIAELSPNIDLKLVLRDENEALMNQFLDQDVSLNNDCC